MKHWLTGPHLLANFRLGRTGGLNNKWTLGDTRDRFVFRIKMLEWLHSKTSLLRSSPDRKLPSLEYFGTKPPTPPASHLSCIQIMTEQKWNLPLLRSVLLISIPPEFVDSPTSFYLVCFLVSLDAPCHSARLLLSMCATKWEDQAPGSLFILVGWFGCSYGHRARSSTQVGSCGSCERVSALLQLHTPVWPACRADVTAKEVGDVQTHALLNDMCKTFHAAQFSPHTCSQLFKKILF